MRDNTFHGVECLVRSAARRGMGVWRSFGDDALSYFAERLLLAPLHGAIARALQQAKRNKAFDAHHLIGFAIDGTGSARCAKKRCHLCHPILDKEEKVVGYNHHFSLIAVAGVGLTLPFDVEPYGPRDSEYTASQRLLRRAVETLGPRFADYVVADGAYATAPFLHTVGELGLFSIARLKGNLPELMRAAERLFRRIPPSCTFTSGRDRVEIWDADDFDPWDSLKWESVRVIRYRQYKPDGDVVEAYWLTDIPTSKVGCQSLYRLAKSRWEIENQGFNDGKNRYGMEHIAHHESNSLQVQWLLTLLAIVIERLYRERYLKRGLHAALTPIQFLRLLRLSLGRSPAKNTG